MPVASATVGAPIADKSLRQIVTPEGVALTVQLASRGERAGAVLIDLLFIFGSILGVTLLLMLAFSAIGDGGTGELGIIIYFILLFAIRSFYFIFFELRWDGVTPGKKFLKIRVIDRQGGPLTADAIFARNLMREVELFLPMSFLFAGPTSQTGAWMNLLGIIWLGVLVLMPLFNKDRLRVGDMVGGTWVINAAKSTLAKDIATAGAVSDATDEFQGSGIRFTAKELRVYGIHELQTLEDVLRDSGREVLDEVAKRIRTKIGWEEIDVTDNRAFLEAYYRALRAELEAKMLFGVRRKDKFDVGDGKGG